MASTREKTRLWHKRRRPPLATTSAEPASLDKLDVAVAAKSSSSSSRNRKDSGFDEDQFSLPVASASTCPPAAARTLNPEDVHRQWTAMVGHFSSKAHAIVTAEVMRMQEMTELRRRELDYCCCRSSGDEESSTSEAAAEAAVVAVMQRWRRQAADLMDVTQDLIGCVANDVAEMSEDVGSVVTSSEAATASSASVTSEDLGQILEEELTSKLAKSMALEDDEEEEEEQKLFLVKKHNSNNSKKNKIKKMFVQAAGAGGSNELWEESGTGFTLEVQRLEKKSPSSPVPEAVLAQQDADLDDEDDDEQTWQWRKDLDSPVVWEAEDKYDDAQYGEADKREDLTMEQKQQEAKETKKETVEDIFRDWARLLRQEELSVEVNEAFWRITLQDEELHRRSGSGRMQRISRVLHNLPFQDQPDIFVDRCELLELGSGENCDGKSATTKRASRPNKCYWNIFSEWKRNLAEEKTDKLSESDLSSSQSDGSGKNKKNKKRPKERIKKENESASEPVVASPKEDSKEQQQLQQQPGLDKQKQKPFDSYMMQKFLVRSKIYQNSRYGWFHFPSSPSPSSPRRYSEPVMVEDLFGDFRDNFDLVLSPSLEVMAPTTTAANERRRRSRDDLESGEADCLEVEAGRARKRLKTSSFSTPCQANWDYIRAESSKSFDAVTRNIEQKIRQAFVRVRREDEAELWRDVDAFREWRWNLEEDNNDEAAPIPSEDAEDILWTSFVLFNEPVVHSYDYDSDIRLRSGVVVHTSERRMRRRTVIVASANVGRNKKKNMMRQQRSGYKCEKSGRRKMRKCFPKQPMDRARGK